MASNIAHRVSITQNVTKNNTPGVLGCSDFVTKQLENKIFLKSPVKEYCVDTWNVLAIFLLGSGAGALLAAFFYSPQIRRLKQLGHAVAAESDAAEQQDSLNSSDILKSA